MMPLEMINEPGHDRKKLRLLSLGKGFRDLTPFLVTSGADNNDECVEDCEDATRRRVMKLEAHLLPRSGQAASRHRPRLLSRL